MVCFSKDVKVPVKIRRTLSSVGTSSSNTFNERELDKSPNDKAADTERGNGHKSIS